MEVESKFQCWRASLAEVGSVQITGTPSLKMISLTPICIGCYFCEGFWLEGRTPSFSLWLPQRGLGKWQVDRSILIILGTF